MHMTRPLSVIEKSVFYIPKEKSLSRHRFTRVRTRTIGNDVKERIHGDTVTSHVEQGSDNSPHHVAQEPVCTNLKIPLCRRGLYPSCRVDVTYSGARVIVCLTKSPEVGNMRKLLSSLVHQVEVKRIVGFYREMPGKRVFVSVDKISIGALHR